MMLKKTYIDKKLIFKMFDIIKYITYNNEHCRTNTNYK